MLLGPEGRAWFETGVRDAVLEWKSLYDVNGPESSVIDMEPITTKLQTHYRIIMHAALESLVREQSSQIDMRTITTEEADATVDRIVELRDVRSEDLVRHPLHLPVTNNKFRGMKTTRCLVAYRPTSANSEDCNFIAGLQSMVNAIVMFSPHHCPPYVRDLKIPEEVKADPEYQRLLRDETMIRPRIFMFDSRIHPDEILVVPDKASKPTKTLQATREFILNLMRFCASYSGSYSGLLGAGILWQQIAAGQPLQLPVEPRLLDELYQESPIEEASPEDSLQLPARPMESAQHTPLAPPLAPTTIW